MKATKKLHDLGPLIRGGGADCEAVPARFTKAGVDLDALAARLQDEGPQSFANSRHILMAVIESRSDALVGQSSEAWLVLNDPGEAKGPRT